MRNDLWRYCVSALLLCVSIGVHAGTVTIVASQDGDDVVLTGSGSIDTSGFTGLTISSLSSDISTPTLFQGINASGFTNVDVYTSNVTNFSPLAPGTNFLQVAAGSDPFGVNDQVNRIILPSTYSSGASLNFIWRITDTTLPALNLNFGTVATFGNNTVQLSQVPLPPAAWLFISALGGLVGVKKWRKHPAN